MHTATPDRTIRPSSQSWLVAGAVTFGLATALSAVGVFAGERDQGQVDAFPALVVFFGVLTGLVFALAVRPATSDGSSSRRVAALGGAALLGLPAFWAGLPVVLGGAALAVRRHAPQSRLTTVGTVLAAVAIAANVILAFAG
jgi:hypothetical protein